jgi:aspartyl-tRNA(Asn)/glutamyl-tRNA(Gln) amidotransferase subunit C
MTSLTADQVRHIAKLARLTLTDAEVEKFATELTSILAYVDRLTKVDTKGIEPLKSVAGVTNNWREDVVTPLQASPDALLDCSPLPIVDHQIQTSSAHG